MTNIPKDSIRFSKGIPPLPSDGVLIARVSPMDLIDGDVRRAVAWDPRKCPPKIGEKVKAILKESSRPGNLNAADCAAWEYFSGGPQKVRCWDDLDSKFQRLTRSELGFIEVSFEKVRLVCVSDDEEDSE